MRAAVRLADEAGLEAFSMRRLAQELSVVPMALYKHVANKDELLDGMVDLVYGEIDVPPIGGDWRKAVRQRAVSTREALTRHRWANGHMESRKRPGPANLRVHNAMLGCLLEAGFSIPMAIHALSVQDAYIYGFALQEETLGVEGAEELADAAEQQVQRFAALAAEYPYLFEVVGGYVAKGGYDFADEFEFGLDLILDGLEGLLATVD